MAHRKVFHQQALISALAAVLIMFQGCHGLPELELIDFTPTDDILEQCEKVNRVSMLDGRRASKLIRTLLSEEKLDELSQKDKLFLAQYIADLEARKVKIEDLTSLIEKLRTDRQGTITSKEKKALEKFNAENLYILTPQENNYQFCLSRGFTNEISNRNWWGAFIITLITTGAAAAISIIAAD